MQCNTSSGPFRCEREPGHDGECECTAPSAGKGPATDAGRASLHLRARLDVAAGSKLERIGEPLNVKRYDGEPDAEYRERIWRAR